MNLVVIASNRNSLGKGASYLAHHGYKIRYMRDLSVALDLFARAKPELVLLSWNLGTNVVASFSKIHDEFGIPCMVFSEDQSPRSMASLTRSRIPNVIFPPLTGPSIHRRIQLLLRERSKRVKVIQPLDDKADLTRSFGTVKIKADELPPDIAWGQVGLEEGGLPKWKGEKTSSSGEQVTYYCLSKDKPVYDQGRKQWSSIESSSVILKGICPIGDEDLRRLMDQSTFDEIRELVNNDERATFTKARAKSWISGAVNSLSSTPTVKMADGAIRSPIRALLVNKDGIKGYLIVGHDAKTDDQKISIFCELILQQCSGEKISTIPVLASFSLFKRWATSTEFCFTELVGGNEILVGFMSADELPDLVQLGGYLKADLENWLEPESTLSFDVFLHMPANNKQIKYFKKDSLITQELLRQYSRLGVPNLLIRAADHQTFIAYCIQVALGRQSETGST